jgi:hypothetical protein
LGWDDLLEHYQRFRALLDALFVLGGGGGFGAAGADHSLGGRIDQHVYRNSDWTMEELFDVLGWRVRSAESVAALILPVREAA